MSAAGGRDAAHGSAHRRHGYVIQTAVLLNAITFSMPTSPPTGATHARAVRQENERLQQETMSRARFVRNLTDVAEAAAAAAVAAEQDLADVDGEIMLGVPDAASVGGP